MSDPRFADVSALLPLDGADASTTIVDESNTGSTDWGFTNGGEISTDQSVYGGSSGRIDSGTWIEYSTVAGTNFVFDVTDAFTFEAHFRPDAIGSSQTLLTSGGLWFGINASGELELDAQTSGSSTIASGTSTATLSATTQHYVEISRDASGDWRVFLDGDLEFTESESAGDVDSQETVRIGRKAGFSDLRPYAGYVDDIRITEGAPRHTASYTVPSTAHPLFGGVDGIGARVQVPSPLSAASALVDWENITRSIVSVPSPLTTTLFANSLIPPQIVITRRDFLGARVSVPSVLAPPRTRVLNDFSSLVIETVSRYIFQITGDPVIQIPISSWQATLQIGRQSYLQAVIPAAIQYLGALSSRQGSEQFIVYRSNIVQGAEVNTEMARAPLSQVIINQGSSRATVTVSGYGDLPDDLASSVVVPLTGIRTISQTIGGNTRIRADIDWFLRPGQTVTGAGLSITASYINYFVPTVGDAHMDVGTRG